MKRYVICFIALAIVTVSCGVSHAMKMNIDPARAEVTLKPGEEKTGVVTVLNYDENSPIHVRAYLQDIVYLPDGSNDFLKPGSTPWSLVDCIKIGPTEFDIPSGKQEAVRYVVSVPKDAKGGRYGVIFFETATPPSEVKQVGATVNVRLGAVILVTLEGTKVVKAKLTAMYAGSSAKEKGGLEISWTVYNDSNILTRPFGTVKIIDTAKREVAVIDANKEKSGILPQTSRKFTVYYKEIAKKLPKGDYFAQIVLDYGGETLLGGQSKFKVD